MGILCTHPGCLASIAWVGHREDTALGNLAKASGWRVFEGSGWLCRAHQPFSASPAVREWMEGLEDTDDDIYGEIAHFGL